MNNNKSLRIIPADTIIVKIIENDFIPIIDRFFLKNNYFLMRYKICDLYNINQSTHSFNLTFLTLPNTPNINISDVLKKLLIKNKKIYNNLKKRFNKIKKNIKINCIPDIFQDRSHIFSTNTEAGISAFTVCINIRAVYDES